MAKIRTHYDNLKVARDAPADVIRAAYRTLSQRYHPDKNPHHPDATRIMSIINRSYEVLSDAAQRKIHDDWIRKAEFEDVSEEPAPGWYKQIPPTKRTRDLRWVRLIGLLLVLILSVAVPAFLQRNDPAGPAVYTPPRSPEPPAPPPYVRASLAPNGEPWPVKTGYLRGFPRLHTDGLSSLTVESDKTADVYGKLFSLDEGRPTAVRMFFIKAGGSFQLEGISPGKYDVRFQNLDSGGRVKSEAFTLEERDTLDGTEFTRMRLTLYTILNGNTRMIRISEAEF